MASLQLTAQRKTDSLACIDVASVYSFLDARNRLSLKAKLDAAGDTDNMTCDKVELELLKLKIEQCKAVGLSEQDMTDMVDLGDTVQAAIDAA